MVRFKAAYVSAPTVPAHRPWTVTSRLVQRIRPWTFTEVP